jgi:hypothetical protein
MANGETQEDKKGPYDNVTEYERYVNHAIPLLEEAFEQWGDLQKRFMDKAPFGSAEAKQISTFITTLQGAARKNVPPTQALKNMRDIETYVEPPFGISVRRMIERLIAEHSSRSAAGVAQKFEEFQEEFDFRKRDAQEKNQKLQKDFNLGRLFESLGIENN